ncbi:MAG: transketolase [Polyangiaceae bacterium]|nr:transketolase [Polyangiaceae bacterium]
MTTPRYENVLRELAEKDERIVVMTAENRAAIRNLPPVLGKRFIDVGICEQTMIGVAAGLALRGRRPVAHALATFITLRAYEFIRDDLGIPNLPGVLVGGVPGFLSDANGPTHQAIDDVALMRTIPNVRVVCPADEHELAEALPVLIQEGAPVYVRHIPLMPAFERKKTFAYGQGEVIEDGDEIGILSYGLCARESVAAAKILKSQGRSVRVVHLPSLKPLDETLVIETLSKCRVTFTIEDHLLSGGLFSIVAELMAKKNKMAKVVPFALEERWFLPTLLKDVLEHEGFTGEKLAQRISRAAEAS